MKTNLFYSNQIFALALLVSGTGFAAEPKILEGEYSVDSAHSKVGFEVSHLVISTVEGKFDTYAGKITMGKKLDQTQFSADIKADGIDTGNADRDKHLKSPDFFDAAKFPSITFKSTKVSGPANDLAIKGDLTIHGVTKSITLKGKYNGVAVDPWGNTKIGLSAQGKISRKEFGLAWSKVVEAGPVVGDEVTLDLKVEAAKVVAKKE